MITSMVTPKERYSMGSVTLKQNNSVYNSLRIMFIQNINNVPIKTRSSFVIFIRVKMTTLNVWLNCRLTIYGLLTLTYNNSLNKLKR